MILSSFNVSEFVAQYWQQKPCIIRGFAANFVEPIDEHDLAGLAQEADIDSRIVAFDNNKWQVAQGPFDDFAPHCQGNWSLLVQGVDKYVDEIAELTNLVSFIPHWRLDDIMVSYSTEHAGVGPHTDEYDVFIVQGKGTRRWQVGLPNKDGGAPYKVVLPHPLLKQIEGFEPIIDEVLQPGDAVYIPPKHPHNGVALGPCMNYSIGFRAPTNAEVLNGLLDEAEGLETAQIRYSDPDILALRSLTSPAEELSCAELERLKSQLVSLLNTPQANEAILKFLSAQQLPVLHDESYQVDAAELGDMLSEQGIITMPSAVRPIYLAEQTSSRIDSAAVFTFYIDSHVFEVDIALKAHLQSLFANKSIDAHHAFMQLNNCASSQDAAWLTIIAQLVNAGYVEWQEEIFD
ncbi:MAG: cupin domain-containing protein [Glaciecola sp.]